jgi:hypothetical protein
MTMWGDPKIGRVKRAADELAKDKRNHPSAEQANSRAGDSQKSV